MMLITDPILQHALETPDKIALVSDTGAVTYAEFLSLSNQVAHALLNTRTKDDPPASEACKVVLLMNNSVEFLQVFVGAAMVGWTAIPLDPKWSARELHSTYLECEPAVLVIDSAYLHKMPPISLDTQVVVYGEPLEPMIIPKWVPFHGWIQPYSNQPPADMSVSDAERFYIGYTSGTTGKPKGFVRAHRQWEASFAGTTLEFGMISDDHVLAPGPFVHSLSMYAVMHTLFIGATFHLVEKFEAQQVLSLMERGRITVAHMVPTMYEALFNAYQQQDHDWNLQHVRTLISTGAKLHETTREKIGHMFPQAGLFEFYGASELSYVTVNVPSEYRDKPDTVGRAFHGVKISFRDPLGQEVAEGEIGKIYVQSDMVFSGYYKNEEATKQLLQEGWATVGDVGYRDQEGFVHLVGREKNMIISGGLNIYPEEVEHILLQLPEVDEVAVIGVGDAYWGEKVVAVIKVKTGALLDEAAVKAYCRENIATFKCPREALFVETFPYTSSGKIARNKLKDLLLATGGQS